MAEISICSPDKGLPVEDLPVPGRLQLFLAASSGDDERLQQLLSPPMAVTSEEDSALVVTNEGNSALHVVATDGDGAGHLESAKVIHDKAKHLLLACNVHGDTPLHCAARAGNTCMVSRLIELAGDAKDMVRVQNKDGKTALHEAIGSDDMQMVQALMSKDNELARLDANDGTSPLFLAISLGHHSIACQLHQYDNDLSHSGPHGRTALHAAVLHDKRIAKSLLDWTKKNKEKTTNLTKQWRTCESTPMHFAASVEDPSLEFFLFAFVNRSLEICSFSLYYHIAPSKLLYRIYVWRKHPIVLLAKTYPSLAFQPDKNGLFPVHVAASAGSLVPIIILLRGCPPCCARLRDAKGRTFLHVAVEKKRLNIVKFVCSRSQFKSIMNIQDKDGNTALHLAIHGGDWDIFKSLICNQHVLLNLLNKLGETPMDIADSRAPSVSGFYFGMHARRRILGTLTFADAQNGNSRRDRFMEEHNESHEDKIRSDRLMEENERREGKKITDFAQIVGIGSVLVATATFAAAFTMPGGFSEDKETPPMGKGGTPTLAGYYAFDGFVISNTLAFICSSLATFSLIYTGVGALDIYKRIELVSFSLALLMGAARSFCAAFAFALYVLLAQWIAGQPSRLAPSLFLHFSMHFGS
ncbi:ankyrin-1-like [Lolium rigidum]|uniref:ankyrin-1-like n=1 Tax=Lolium rigidum TaxID=89674 RepID=UPI001F5E0225|nr:ankyrin-1-like [Lolium rigidum]